MTDTNKTKENIKAYIKHITPFGTNFQRNTSFLTNIAELFHQIVFLRPKFKKTRGSKYGNFKKLNTEFLINLRNF